MIYEQFFGVIRKLVKLTHLMSKNNNFKKWEKDVHNTVISFKQEQKRPKQILKEDDL